MRWMKLGEVLGVDEQSNQRRDERDAQRVKEEQQKAERLRLWDESAPGRQ
jgi:hypothetical protein